MIFQLYIHLTSHLIDKPDKKDFISLLALPLITK